MKIKAFLCVASAGICRVAPSRAGVGMSRGAHREPYSVVEAPWQSKQVNIRAGTVFLPEKLQHISQTPENSPHPKFRVVRCRPGKIGVSRET